MGFEARAAHPCRTQIWVPPPGPICWVLVLSWHFFKKRPIKWSSLYTTTNCRPIHVHKLHICSMIDKDKTKMFQVNDEYKWSVWYGLFLHEQLIKRQVLQGGYSSMIWVGSDLKSRPILIPNFPKNDTHLPEPQIYKKKKTKKKTLFSKIFNIASFENFGLIKLGLFSRQF